MNNHNFSIVDVRTPQEFTEGHIAESINIPLIEIEQRINEIESLQQPILLCCASGMRSSQATRYLKTKGINCANGGSWMELNFKG